MPQRLKNFSKSANRALDVLSYLAAKRSPARSAEIADALGMARSSADQLLKTMISGGYLVLSAQDKGYFPSLRLVSFGRWISECYPMEKNLRQIVDDLHAETGQIVTLTMQNDCYMQIMEVARGADKDPILNVGVKVPVIGSAIGVAALSTKNRNEILKLMSRARYQRATLDEINSIGPLIQLVRRYQNVGYSARATRRSPSGSDSEKMMDYWSIAMTVPTTSMNGASMVLGLCGPVNHMHREQDHFVALMRDIIKSHLPFSTVQ
jgi:DNA-binding IclR family transcriptional regulator